MPTEITDYSPENSELSIKENEEITFSITYDNNVEWICWNVGDEAQVKCDENSDYSELTINGNDYDIETYLIKVMVYNNGDWLEDYSIEWNLEIKEDNMGQIVFITPSNDSQINIKANESVHFEFSTDEAGTLYYFVNGSEVKTGNYRSKLEYDLDDVTAGETYEVEAVAQFSDNTHDSIEWTVNVEEAEPVEITEYYPTNTDIDAEENESINFSCKTNVECDIEWAVNGNSQKYEENTTTSSFDYNNFEEGTTTDITVYAWGKDDVDDVEWKVTVEQESTPRITNHTPSDTDITAGHCNDVEFAVTSNTKGKHVFYVDGSKVKERSDVSSINYTLSDVMAGDNYNIECEASYDDGSTDSISWNLSVVTPDLCEKSFKMEDSKGALLNGIIVYTPECGDGVEIVLDASNEGIASIDDYENSNYTVEARYYTGDGLSSPKKESGTFTCGDTHTIVFDEDAGDCEQTFRFEDKDGNEMDGQLRIYYPWLDSPSKLPINGEQTINASRGIVKIKGYWKQVEGESGTEWFNLCEDSKIVFTYDTTVQECTQDFEVKDDTGKPLNAHIIVELTDAIISEKDISGTTNVSGLTSGTTYEATAEVNLEGEELSQTKEFEACGDTVEFVFERPVTECSQTIKLVDKDGNPIDGTVELYQDNNKETSGETSDSTIIFDGLTSGTNYEAVGIATVEEKELEISKVFTACTDDDLKIVFAETQVLEVVLSPHSYSSQSELYDTLNNNINKFANYVGEKIKRFDLPYEYVDMNVIKLQQNNNVVVQVHLRKIENGVSSLAVVSSGTIVAVVLGVISLIVLYEGWIRSYIWDTSEVELSERDEGDVKKESLKDWLAMEIHNDTGFDYQKSSDFAEEIWDAECDQSKIQKVFEKYDVPNSERKSIAIGYVDGYEANTIAQADISDNDKSWEIAEEFKDTVDDIKSDIENDDIVPSQGMSKICKEGEEIDALLSESHEDDGKWGKYIMYGVGIFGGAYIIGKSMSRTNIYQNKNKNR